MLLLNLMSYLVLDVDKLYVILKSPSCIFSISIETYVSHGCLSLCYCSDRHSVSKECCVYTLNTGDLYTKREQSFENSTGGVYYGTHLPLLITKGKRKSMCMCACLRVCLHAFELTSPRCSSCCGLIAFVKGIKLMDFNVRNSVSWGSSFMSPPAYGY